MLCVVLSVSESGYYEWATHKPSRSSRRNPCRGSDKAHIKQVEGRMGEEITEGPLRARIRAGECRIRRIRNKLGIKCIQKKKYKATTDSKHNLPVAANL